MAMKPAYFAREAASNLRRNLLMALASILAVAISLFLVGSVLMFFKVVQNITRQWENDVVINAFIKDDATPAQIAAAKSTILGYKEVKGAKFVSKADAYDEFKDMFRDQKGIVESVTAETLPASFRISLKDPQTLPAVSSRLEKVVGIDDVVSAKDTVKRVQTLLQWLSLIVLGAAAVLLAAAIVLISNTIRLAIFARRKEIAIMKLVGATNWFIRWPFMLEGLVQGLVGAIVAIGLMLLVNQTLFGLLRRSVPFVPFGISGGWMFLSCALVAIIGALIAVGGTSFALRKYLEV